MVSYPKLSNAVLSPEQNANHYFCNTVKFDKILQTSGWTSIELRVNAGVSSFPLGQHNITQLKDRLDYSNLSITVVNNIVAVCTGEEDFYSFDITSLFALIKPHQRIEAIIGYGIRQIVVLFIDENFTGERPYFFGSEALNPQNLPECTQIHQNSIFSSAQSVQCRRPAHHAGSHHSLDVVPPGYAQTQFNNGGASQSWTKPFGIPTPCTDCGFMMKGTGSPVSCSSCSFWHQQKTRPENAFIINGRHYRPGKGGFDGRKFTVERFDGTSWSGELFTQGEIPSHFLPLFPDNAKFVNSSSSSSAPSLQSSIASIK